MTRIFFVTPGVYVSLSTRISNLPLESEFAGAKVRWQIVQFCPLMSVGTPETGARGPVEKAKAAGTPSRAPANKSWRILVEWDIFPFLSLDGEYDARLD